MSFESEVTVVIPTFERPRFAWRSICHLEACGLVGLVIDGSKVPLLDSATATDLRTVRYIHSPVALHERLRQAAQLLETPYAILKGDDEFHLPQGLLKCWDVIRKDSAVSSVCGHPLFQSLLPNQKWNVYPWLSGSPPLDWWNGSVTDANRIHRLTRHFTPLLPTSMYGLVRREFFEAAFTEIERLGNGNVYEGEYFIESLAALTGYICVIPVVMWIRSGENSSITNSVPDVDFFSFTRDSGGFEGFSHSLVSALSSILQQESIPASLIVDAFDDLAKKRLDARADTDLQTGKSMFSLRNLWERLPAKWRVPIRSILDVPLRTFSRDPWIRAGKRAQAAGLHVSLDDLKLVSRLSRETTPVGTQMSCE